MIHGSNAVAGLDIAHGASVACMAFMAMAACVSYMPSHIM